MQWSYGSAQATPVARRWGALPDGKPTIVACGCAMPQVMQHRAAELQCSRLRHRLSGPSAPVLGTGKQDVTCERADATA